MADDLRQRIAEALMQWAEGNSNPTFAAIRRPETVTKNAYGRADAVLAVRDDEMEALRERLRKAERAVDLLAGSHRRAEEAEARIASALDLADRIARYNPSGRDTAARLRAVLAAPTKPGHEPVQNPTATSRSIPLAVGDDPTADTRQEGEAP